MSRKIAALATVPESSEDNILRFDDAPEFFTNHGDDSPGEDMDKQVKDAQQRLATLRAQQEEVERQKMILENLRQKQDRFVSGKRDVVEKMDRSLRAIGDELEEARRRVDDLAITHKDFQDHLEELKTILPERWHRSQLDQELDGALGALSEAEVCYEKGIRRVSNGRPVETSSFHLGQAQEEEMATPSFGPSAFSNDDLVGWLRRGFAFTLPLMATILIALIIAKLMF